MDEKRVWFPNELLQKFLIETTIFPENMEEVGVAALSETEGSSYILRLYQLLYFEDEETYKPVQELAALRFQKRNELTDFLDELPDINGLEMLMLLNPLPQGDEERLN